VVVLESIDFSLQWGAMLSGRIVGDVKLRQPKLNINLTQMREEARDRAQVEKRGWQAAVKAIYPLKINLLTIQEGELTYVDQDPQNPLKVRRVIMKASNIRNVVDPDDPYPSSLKVEAIVFEEGKLKINGKANFLSEPILSLSMDLKTENIPLNRFDPVLQRYHLDLEKGLLDADALIEITPRLRTAHFKSLHVRGLKVDFIRPVSASPEAHKAVKKSGEAVEEVSNNPQFKLQIDAFKVDGEIGMINTKANPRYRIFISDADLHLTNLSNHFRQGPAQIHLTGAFMGSGRTDFSATFRPEDHGPDFDLKATIEDTRLVDMNDLLSAYGDFDVNSGLFTIYSELQIKNERIDGYVKPFFKNVDVYDRRQDKDKSLFGEMYEGLVEGIHELLSRGPQDQAAARTELSGEMEKPKASTWQTVVTLVQNAFFKTILPGFDRAISE